MGRKRRRSFTPNELAELETLATAFAFDRRSADEAWQPIVYAGTGQPLNKPELLLSLAATHEEATRLFFEGLRLHHFHALTSGRIEAWRAAGHAIIDLCSSIDEAAITSRANVGYWHDRTRH